jgi:sulfate permease, SulP family
LSAGVMAITFALVLIVPLQYAVLAGATISVLKYLYLASLDVRVVQVVIGDDGRAREIVGKPALDDSAVTVLDIYGSLFFAAAPKVRASLPPAAPARRAVVVLRLRGRGALPSAVLTLLGDYAAGLAKGGGRLYLAGVGPETGEQLRRTHLLDKLGTDAVVPATDEFYGACEAAQRRGRQWLASVAAQSPEAQEVAAAQATDHQDVAAPQPPEAKVVAAPRSDR